MSVKRRGLAATTVLVLVTAGAYTAAVAAPKGSGTATPAAAGLACKNGKINVSSDKPGATCGTVGNTVYCHGPTDSSGASEIYSGGSCDADGNAVCTTSEVGSPCTVSIVAAPPSNTVAPPTVFAPAAAPPAASPLKPIAPIGPVKK